MRIERLPRRGLTLVELMVAAALSLVIMTVLASAFQTGMDTLSQLKSVGELQERLRVATERLKDDLKAPHFDDPAVAGGRLSNVRYDQNAAANPTSGAFRIVQAGATYQEAGVTTDPRYYSSLASPSGKVGYTTAGFNLPLRDATKGGNAHAMQMAVKLDGKTRQRVFTAPRPAQAPGKALDNKFDNLVQDPTASYATRWAVVSYFLVDSGTKTGNGTALFNLHRRVQLLAEEPNAVILAADPNFSLRPLGANGTGPFAVNTVNDLTSIVARPGSAASFPAVFGASAVLPAFSSFLPLGDGTDIVLTNVVSFEIKANWDSPAYRKLAPVPTAGPVSGTGDVPNPDYPFDDLPVNLGSPGTAVPVPLNQSSLFEATPRVFDTAEWKSGEALLGIPTANHAKVRVNALQIKLRIWDAQNRTARQVTIIQDL